MMQMCYRLALIRKNQEQITYISNLNISHPAMLRYITVFGCDAISQCFERKRYGRPCFRPVYKRDERDCDTVQFMCSLYRVIVDPEPLPRILNIRQEYTQNGTDVHHKVPV